MNNLVLATEAKHIVFLSEIVEGSHSEKRLADEVDFSFGSGEEAQQDALVALLVDLGFPGTRRGALPWCALIRSRVSRN